MLDLEFAERSDVGSVRQHNEDALGHAIPTGVDEQRKRGCLFVLADGAGGEAHGEIASATAVETLLSCFNDDVATGPARGLLRRFVQVANSRVYRGAAAQPGTMCTTLVVCLLRDNYVTVAHVGDSRAYLIRRGSAKVLTNDHTLVAEQIRMGLLSSDEAARSEKRNLLSRSLGANPVVEPEINEHELLAGDILLLSTDGLHASFTSTELAVITTKTQSLTEAALQLVSLARERDGSDNISVQLIRITRIDRIGMYRGRAYNLR